MKRWMVGCLSCTCVAWALPLQAAEPIRVSLSGQAETEVANDEAVITLEVMREGKDQEGVRREVNAMADRIVEALRKSPDITVQTVGRATYPIRRNETVVGWSVHQTFQVTDRNVEDLGWTGKVEKMGGSVQGVSFRVSDEGMRQAKRGLLDQAADDFRAQAAKVAALFGNGRYRIESLNIDGAAPPATPMPMMAVDALRAGGAPAPMPGGSARVHMGISGVVVLEAPSP